MIEPVSGDSPEVRLAELGLELPPPPAPLASYVPFTYAGELIVTSGVLPMREGRVIQGRLGADLTVLAGAEAARTAAVGLLALLAAAAGKLDRITGLVLLTGYVRSAPDFARQSDVIDGASQLLIQVLGEQGHHARVAVGVAELPREACLELQLIARR
ncbi:MAG TPA: RidA family protein [Candidatus Dormibacteraeota bacterium]|nr:RidA family protein [Candidatus Dormibacteraeota bacterium]